MAFQKVTEIIKEAPAFAQLTDLAAARLGGKVLYATDDFFAEKENLIMPGRGIFITDKYTDRGKWMDGWESRRKRTPGHDWCVVQLAAPGRIAGFDIDTNFFLGNHPPHASIEAARIDNPDAVTDWETVAWTEILSKSPLDPGSQNFYACSSTEAWSHLRLHIYPDGGVARLKVYGHVEKDWNAVPGGTQVDLAAAINGGQAIACNDMFFSAMGNLLMPGRGINMGDGWETKRNRTPNNRDWVVLRLAHPGIISRVVVDTAHFKGNYPDRCSLDAINAASDEDALRSDAAWQPLMPEQKLGADNIHDFMNEIAAVGPATHVRLNIFPDGGISRLRLFGTPTKD
ncbi:allantoicase [Flaviaesturariibacter flavus]|uniref:Probable allantoicase n=1 Tax=Flaviaesturariibacter flavus TaxID=2502780 RepID=A0A4R1BPP9_9BACT|nr:allantoicase [Flaviaesturariibacter flavus]TCJ19619.1 allantoicase [Flaviaesturariibacter flavus]